MEDELFHLHKEIRPLTVNLAKDTPEIQLLAISVGIETPPFGNTWVEHWPSGRLVIWNQYQTIEVPFS